MSHMFAPLVRRMELPPVGGRPAMPGRIEFVAMMALLMGVIAIGIDLMLPAMDQIAADLGQASSADVAPMVTTYFLGLALGQVLWGPWADRFGRKFSLNVGLGLLIVAALAAAATSSLAVMLVIRFVWGFGASAARSTTMTVVRDRYRGDRMASVTSLIFSVFILVPVVAPSIGSLGLQFTSWRGLFVAVAAFAVALLVWLRRLPETLDPNDVRAASPRAVVASVRLVFSHRVTVGYLFALTALSAAFTAWIALSEPVINNIYGLEAIFPYVFGGLAFGMAVAALANSTIVERLGARRLVRISLIATTGLTTALAGVAIVGGGVPPLWVTFGVIGLVLMSQAFLQSNAQSLAMDPMGKVAGLASAVIGAISLGVGTVVGALVQVFHTDDMVPLAVAWALASVVALLWVRWANLHPAPAQVHEAATPELASLDQT